MVVENAFGRLKGRWRSLLKRMDYNLLMYPTFLSCVVLHNVCEMYRDESVTVLSATPSTAGSTASCVRDAIYDYLSPQ